MRGPGMGKEARPEREGAELIPLYCTVTLSLTRILGNRAALNVMRFQGRICTYP
jgi:hypothetical protein